MKNYKTIAWMYLSVAMAADKNSSEIETIALIADGINHAVPTTAELEHSLDWLIEKQLISKIDTRYQLTEKGKQYYHEAERLGGSLTKILDRLAVKLKLSF